MKILYLVSRPIEINTSSSIRNASTINGLRSIGCEVELLTSMPDVNHPNYDESIAVNGVKRIYVDVTGGIQALERSSRRIKIPRIIKETFAKWMNATMMYDKLSVMTDAVLGIDMDMSTYDAVISSSDPKSSHLVAEKLIHAHREFYGKWIQIWGDPFVGDIAVKRSKHLERKIMEEESRLLKSCDSIIYVSNITKEEQQNLYPAIQHKMHFVPIPYFAKSVSKPKQRVPDRIKLAYCGDYNKTIRDIVPLIEAVSDYPGVLLTVCGDGNTEIEDAQNLKVYPRLSRKKILDIEDAADVLIHLSNRSGSQIPGKIYQYSGTDKAILFILDGEVDRLQRLFEKYNRFAFCKNEKEDIRRVINEIMEGNRTELLTPIEEFSPSNIAKQIINLI